MGRCQWRLSLTGEARSFSASLSIEATSVPHPAHTRCILCPLVQYTIPDLQQWGDWMYTMLAAGMSAFIHSFMEGMLTLWEEIHERPARELQWQMEEWSDDVSELGRRVDMLASTRILEGRPVYGGLQLAQQLAILGIAVNGPMVGAPGGEDAGNI